MCRAAGIALALTVASLLSVGPALAQSDGETGQQRYVYEDLFGVESVTEFPGIQYVPVFSDVADCKVDESTVRNLVRWETQKDRGIKLRFVSFREFNERAKELRARPAKILEAGKPFIADFMASPEGKLWKDAVGEAKRYGRMPVLQFTVRTGRIEQTCLAIVEAKLTTLVEPRSFGLVRVELWSDDKSVRASQAEYTISIAAAVSSLWSRLIDEWNRAQAFCAAQPPCKSNKIDD